MTAIGNASHGRRSCKESTRRTTSLARVGMDRPRARMVVRPEGRGPILRIGPRRPSQSPSFFRMRAPYPAPRLLNPGHAGGADGMTGRMVTNADIGELLWTAGREEPGHRRRALERASRAARFWPEETYQLVDTGRSLTELPAVGPWVAAKIHGWLDDPPSAPEPEEARRGFLTYAEVRRTLDVDPQWEADPCADLQVHTTFSDGGLPLPEMVEAARSLCRPYVAITDHSQTLTIANGMTPQ